MPRAVKVKVDESLVRESLPTIPNDKYSHSIERVSPMVIKVWLNHHHDYDFACGKPVRTIYCFLKNDKVHPPLTHDKMRVRSLCHISELYQQSPYTTMIPKSTNLLDLV